MINEAAPHNARFRITYPYYPGERTVWGHYPDYASACDAIRRYRKSYPGMRVEQWIPFTKRWR